MNVYKLNDHILGIKMLTLPWRPS